MASLEQILKPGRLTAVVDVGAAAIDSPPPYLPLLERKLCTVRGFEPQSHLWGKQDEHQKITADVIGDGKLSVLHVCACPGMTSLFPPNEATLRCFPAFEQWAKVLQEAPVHARRLDHIEDVMHIDFLKADVQGAEMGVILGAYEKLKNAVFVQVEVAFVPIYEGQPMFRDVDSWLNKYGFILHTFDDISKRMILPFQGATPYEAMNQVQAADAVYVRDFRFMDRMTDEQLKHMGLIAHYCYRSYDLAYRCVTELVNRRAISIASYFPAEQI